METSCKIPQLSEQSFLLDPERKRTESLSGRASFPMTPKFLRESSRASVRFTEFGFSISKPISLLVLNIQDHQFHLSQAATNYLESLQGECFIISVSGNPLVGKSSLLNLILSFFNMDASQENISYQDMYTVGNGKKGTTEGIDMYCLSKNGKNFIFLDVEGDNDPIRKETGVWIYTNLIQTALGVSHVHLYNYNGLPQESYFKYFETISKIVTQNNVHNDFQTKYAFIKRNYSLASKSALPEELEDFKLYFDERLRPGDLDYSLHLLPMPPQHIIERKSKDSCIASTGLLCEDCQGHLFTSILLDFSNELNQNISRMVPFQDGIHVVRTLQQITKINHRELPFFLDGGHISKIRLNSFAKEHKRIQANLLEVEQLQDSNKLYKEIQKIMNDHPNLAKPELYERFSVTQASLVTKISQMGYIIPELSRFVEQYLLDDKASILDQEEKEALWETYVARFDTLTNQIITSLSEYDAMIQSVCQNLLDIQKDTKTNLEEYMAVASNSFDATMAVLLEIGASGLIGATARDLGIKFVAGALVGGGVTGAALTAYFFIKAYNRLKRAKAKHEEALNAKKIEGINSVKDAKEVMKKMEEFVTQLVEELEGSRETLRSVCGEEKSGNAKLIETIKEVMDNKINGMRLSVDNRARLIEGMKVAENNLQRFKNCL